MNKIQSAFYIIKYFKNWATNFSEYFGFIKSGEIIYEMRNGVKYKVRAGTRDRFIINEIWLQKIYTPTGFEIKKSDIVLDIGAQIGTFTIFAAHYAKNGKVFSFEPVSENYQMLTDNIDLNDADNVLPINKAVGDKNGKLTIFLSTENTGGHSSVEALKGSNKKIIVPMVSLDSFVKEQGIKKIDLFKMDTEGAEYSILFNTSDKTFAMIQKISMEYHNLDDSRNVDALKEFLQQKGFEVKVSDQYDMLYAKK